MPDISQLLTSTMKPIDTYYQLVKDSRLSQIELDLRVKPQDLRDFCVRENAEMAACFQIAWAATDQIFKISDSLGFDFMMPHWSDEIISCRSVLDLKSRFSENFTRFGIKEHSLPTGHLEVSNGLEQKSSEYWPCKTMLVYQKSDFSLHHQPEVELSACVVCCLYILESVDSHYMKLTFDTRRLSRLQALSILHTFDAIISCMYESPGAKLQDCNFLSSFDRQLIRLRTSKVSKVQHDCIHNLVSRQATLTPHAQAICAHDGNMTYAELDRLSSALACRLVANSAGPGVIVGVLYEKSMWAYVSMIAVLKSGSAFVGLEASHPLDYLENIIKRTRATLVVASDRYADRLAHCVALIVAVSPRMVRELSSAQMTELKNRSQSSDPCFVLFSSGSSGVPKAIVHEHASFCTAVLDYARVLDLGPHTRILCGSEFSYDISNVEFFSAILTGGVACIVPQERFFTDITGCVRDTNANMMLAVPTILAVYQPSDVPSLEILCSLGEPLTKDIIKRWAPHARLINQYGMSECAVWVSIQNHITSEDAGANIGHPGSGAIWIVDPENVNVLRPVGAIGEIIVEGPNLARGYLDGDPNASASFIDAPTWFKDMHPERVCNRMYRTNDLARYCPDGTIECLGRKDRILKLDGTSIHPEEIEGIVSGFLGENDRMLLEIIGTATPDRPIPILAALFYFSKGTPESLVAAAEKSTTQTLSNGSKAQMRDDSLETTYTDLKFVSHPERNPANIALTFDKIRNELCRKLPPSDVPTAFINIERIPTTVTGKTNRRILQQEALLLYEKYKCFTREL